MAYSSVIFLFYFLPIILIGYYLLPKILPKNIFLFFVSLVFYLWGAGTFVVLIPVIGIMAWIYSLLITKTNYKGFFLLLAILTFTGILIYYKYLGFILENFGLPGIADNAAIKPIIPIGISFIAFQAISYTVDVFRENRTFEKNPAFVMLYIAMFPQLISGPLVRYDQLEPQMRMRNFDLGKFTEGIRRFIIGLAKKVLIANSLSFVVDRIMNTDLNMIGPSVAWMGIIAYAVQIFFDFSGYTDMAIGVGKMLGFDLPENFNYPYVSRSITEFWRRWHMTLSVWLRDYLYMPMSLRTRNAGKTGMFLSLLVTFTICGIWHGPGWTFIIWGAIHGFFLGIETLFLGKILKKIKIFSVIYTLLVVLIAWVFFRMENIGQALSYLKIMFTPADNGTLGTESFFAAEHWTVLAVGILLCVPFALPVKFQERIKGNVMKTASTAVLLIIFILSVMRVVTETFNPFIYFKF